MKRILRYLKGTVDYGLCYKRKSQSDECIGYSDSDWAGDMNDRKSTSGYVFHLNGAVISWRSKKQSLYSTINCRGGIHGFSKYCAGSNVITSLSGGGMSG